MKPVLSKVICQIQWSNLEARLYRNNEMRPVHRKPITSQMMQSLKTPLVAAKVWGSIPGSVKSDTASPTARYRCDVSSELCCPGAKSRKGRRHSLHASA